MSLLGILFTSIFLIIGVISLSIGMSNDNFEPGYRSFFISLGVTIVFSSCIIFGYGCYQNDKIYIKEFNETVKEIQVKQNNSGENVEIIWIDKNNNKIIYRKEDSNE